MQRGFTLLEIVVAASVFSIAVGAMISLFMVGIRGQRNAIARQNLVENTRFALEHMTRQIRMATRDESGSCLGVGDIGSTFVSTGSSLTFLDYRNPSRCVTYALEGGRIMMRRDLGEEFVDLTSDDIIVGDLEFSLRGGGQERWRATSRDDFYRGNLGRGQSAVRPRSRASNNSLGPKS